MVTTGITFEDRYKLIKEGNQQLKGQINSLNETVNEAKKDINNINNKYRDIEKENSLLKSKNINLENKLKKYNLVIYGVKESDKRPMEDTLSTIEEKLEFQIFPSAVRDCFRIGKKLSDSDNRARPLVVEFVNYNVKQKVLEKARKLPKEEYAKRKLLHQHLKKARQASNSAFIKNNILYVNGKAFTWEKLQNDDIDDHQDEGIIETVISKQDKNTEEQPIPQDTKRLEKRLQDEPSKVNKIVPARSSKSTLTSSQKRPKLRSTSK
ncbi:unnamed protein product [Acanthoscelides obtectus]|uniref:Endonuclease-reverse transcriptase n=1 Tax=Acanthoscelides obtectus TaxID=200917 RepID=A0A9P0PPV0_ACAOB|nr:unnamed protein product [Acanthoscelides obtectus]CAK1655724.1 hypothetical protein AOBTE_LOCUS19282 [Acanthoscelides obtectus]